MVAETPPAAAQQQEAGAIVPVGQAQKSASGSVVNQADIEQVKKLLTQVRVWLACWLAGTQQRKRNSSSTHRGFLPVLHGSARQLLCYRRGVW